jgi:hypothetical protein
MRLPQHTALLICLLGPTWTACGDDAAGAGSASALGRGSDACRDWQDAICDFAADECHKLARGTCDEQFQGVVCKSDDVASACSNQANKASCTTQPSESCDLSGVADPAPAVKSCTDMLDATCKWEITCDPTVDMATCQDELRTKLNCDRAVAIKLRYEACMDGLAKLSCSAMALPADCTGVIVAAP